MSTSLPTTLEQLTYKYICNKIIRGTDEEFQSLLSNSPNGIIQFFRIFTSRLVFKETSIASTTQDQLEKSIKIPVINDNILGFLPIDRIQKIAQLIPAISNCFTPELKEMLLLGAFFKNFTIQDSISNIEKALILGANLSNNNSYTNQTFFDCLISNILSNNPDYYSTLKIFKFIVDNNADIASKNSNLLIELSEKLEKDLVFNQTIFVLIWSTHDNKMEKIAFLPAICNYIKVLQNKLNSQQRIIVETVNKISPPTSSPRNTLSSFSLFLNK